MKKGRNNFYEKTCPYCDSIGVRYADQPFLHWIRKIYGSGKRYCPECHQKWRLRARQKSNFLQELMVVMVAGVLGFSVFYGVRSTDDPVTEFRQTQMQEQLGKQGALDPLGGRSSNDPQYPGPPYIDILKSNSADVSQAIHAYGARYAESEPAAQRKMLHRAKEYLTTYEKSSNSEKKKLFEDAKRRIREMNV